MVYKIPPVGGGKPYLATGLIKTAKSLQNPNNKGSISVHM